MKPSFPHIGPDGNLPGSGDRAPDQPPARSRAWREDRACCCPAPPVVRVIMPPTTQRRHSVDLLLCGHHYRISRPALAAARCRVESLPGKAEDVAAALLHNSPPNPAGQAADRITGIPG